MEAEPQKPIGITRLTVAGYKSIIQECSIDIAPLTILAGANSSGKSSMIQPLLLIKQTLEAPFDPGALLLNGPNVRFTQADQLLSKPSSETHSNTFSVGICINEEDPITVVFQRAPGVGFRIEKMTAGGETGPIELHEDLPHTAIESILPAKIREVYDNFLEDIDYEFGVERNRSFFNICAYSTGDNSLVSRQQDAFMDMFQLETAGMVPQFIHSIIHLTGLRGNPERAYPVTAVGFAFPGTFERYTASVITQWQSDGDTEKLSQLCDSLKKLHLASSIQAQSINDIQVELRISRSLNTDAQDDAEMVNIADVGVGVSQTLPILVALIAAQPGQLVYIEQPEIHLHPRAQIALAEILAAAAHRGVRVVAETHSALLLLAIQTLVAEGRLPPELVKLHWFTCDTAGTHVTTTELDRAGAFTEDWPEDFGGIELQLQNRYLNATEAVQYGDMT